MELTIDLQWQWIAEPANVKTGKADEKHNLKSYTCIHGTKTNVGQFGFYDKNKMINDNVKRFIRRKVYHCCVMHGPCILIKHNPNTNIAVFQH